MEFIKYVMRQVRILRQSVQSMLGGLCEYWRLYSYRMQGYKIGDWVRIGPNVMLGGKISIGENTMVVGNARIQGDVEIGSNVVIAPNCTILGVNHDFDRCNALPYGTDYIVRKIVIERNTWLGMHVKILGGAHIEEGAIIGMGSIVTGRIPAGAVAVGIPARVIKYRNMQHYSRLCREQKYIGAIRRKFPNQARILHDNSPQFEQLIAMRGFMLDFEIHCDNQCSRESILYQLAVSHKTLFGNAGPYFAAIRPDFLSLIDDSFQEILRVIQQYQDDDRVDADLLLVDLKNLSDMVHDPEKIISGKGDFQNWFYPPVL